MRMSPPFGRFGIIRRALVPTPQQAGSPSPGWIIAGFTLIEFLIAIAMVLILAAIAVPRIMRVQQTARDTAILADLQALSDELNGYRMGCGGYPEDLDALNRPAEEGWAKGSSPVSDPVTFSGYRLSYTATNPDENGFYAGYTLTADPTSADAAGVQFYFVDQTGILRVHKGAPATASDPPVVPCVGPVGATG